MTKIQFSKAALERVTPPPAGRLYLYDRATPGLVLQITTTGARSFQLYRKLDGRPVRVTLGRFDPQIPDAMRLPESVQAGTVASYVAGFPLLNVAMARRLVELLRASHGARPAEVKRAARGLPTVKDVLDDYQRLHLEAHRRPATLANWFVPGRKHLAQFEGRRVDRLEPSELARWHTTLGATKATAANRALEVLRSAISWSMERNGLRLAANPAAGIQPHAETERERFVLRSEVGRFFAALELTPQPWRDLLLLSLLTGQRRGAVQALRWDHLDLGGGIWYLPAFSSKNSKAAAVPLVRPVVELLERRPRIGGSPFVFPARSKSGHVGSPKKEWARLLERSGLQDLRPHDLRRTIGSWMAAANTSLHVIGSALGHASKESTAIYARLQHEPVRAALTSAANEIIAAARPKRRRA